MYKNFSIDEIKMVKNDFIPHLYNVIKREKCQWINDLVKFVFKEWNELYYFDKWDIFFRIIKKWDNLELSDEIEKIQLTIPMNDKSKLQDLIKNYIIKKERMLWQKTFKEILIDIFQTWEYDTIDWKPYIVYDIETTVWSWDLDSFKFLLAYSATAESWKMNYEYIAKEDLHDFAKKLIDFDWYIIWFNSLAFDNPITIKQWWFTDEDLEAINKKSLDIFYFMRNLTWKRLSLNKVSELIWWNSAWTGSSQKTLEWWWSEVEVLYKEFEKTWNIKYLNTAKDYCKNDVRMTVLVLLYLLHFKKVAVDEEESHFDINDFIKLAKTKDEIKNDKKTNFTSKSIF